MSAISDYDDVHSALQITLRFKRGAFAEQCNFMFDFNFLAIFPSVLGVHAEGSCSAGVYSS